jgi:hypothetical protein
VDYRLLLTTGGPLKAERITVGLYGRERVRVWMAGPAGTPPAPGATPGDPIASPSTTGRETTTFQQVDTVATSELTLPAGQTREYTGQIRIPADAQPTYRGVHAQHVWWVRAVVEIPLGTDIVEETEVRVR